MPYIESKRRVALSGDYPDAPDNAGELNYLITQLIIEYWRVGPSNYQTINDIIGALEGAKAEFQRRVVAPYEDTKIEKNGDVYLTHPIQVGKTAQLSPSNQERYDGIYGK